ncbi:MAG: FliM/FliN family flagellar motor switch protein, partial [Puniceicoccales bacterium]|nr:FliM/FliN family flagellar motor switch protein [Puniceicoccales bacterium]
DEALQPAEEDEETTLADEEDVKPPDGEEALGKTEGVAKGEQPQVDGSVPVNKISFSRRSTVPVAKDTKQEQSELGVKSDALSVTLTFETGRQKITLGELGTVKAGYTFVCENPVEAPVEIRANGTLVGYGQLVDVEGKFGVQIIEFTKKC